MAQIVTTLTGKMGFPLKILAFDTSFAACTVALNSDHTVHSLHQVAPMQQARLLLPMVNDVLSQAGCQLADVDAIAFGCGPASFTGIRIAASTAQGLAFTQQKPLIPLSSLAILAQSACHEHGGRDFLVVVDARMDQVYYAHYRVDAHGVVELVGAEQVVSPNNIPHVIPEGIVVVGDGWRVYGDILQAALGGNVSRVFCEQVPQPQAVLDLAVARFEQKNWVQASDALPVYLR